MIPPYEGLRELQFWSFQSINVHVISAWIFWNSATLDSITLGPRLSRLAGGLDRRPGDFSWLRLDLQHCIRLRTVTTYLPQLGLATGPPADRPAVQYLKALVHQLPPSVTAIYIRLTVAKENDRIFVINTVDWQTVFSTIFRRNINMRVVILFRQGRHGWDAALLAAMQTHLAGTPRK